MDINKLTQKSQEALAPKRRASRPDGSHRSRRRTSVDGADRPARGLVPRLLDQAGADTAALRADLERELNRRPKVSGPGAAPGQVSVTRRLANLLEAAEREAKRLKDDYVSVEHLVIALAEEGSASATGRILASHGVAGIVPWRADQGPRQPAGHFSVAGGAYEALEKYGRDLVAEGRAGKLDPVIGRDAEIRGVIRDPQPQDEEQSGAHRRSRCRQDGDRGGPGPADRSRRCPRRPAGQDNFLPRHGFAGGELRSIGVIRGTAAGRVLSEVKAGEGQILLFVDEELHTVVGAGATEGRWTPATCSSRCLPR